MHECRNWERGRAVSFVEISVSNFEYNAASISARVEVQYISLPKDWSYIHLYDALYVYIFWPEFSWCSGYNSCSFLHVKMLCSISIKNIWYI